MIDKIPVQSLFLMTAKESLPRKGNLTENRTLSEVEVSLLTGVCILRLRAGSN